MRPEFNQLLQCLADHQTELQCQYAASLSRQSHKALLEYDHVFDQKVAIMMADLNTVITKLQEIASETYELRQINQITSQTQTPQ